MNNSHMESSDVIKDLATDVIEDDVHTKSYEDNDANNCTLPLHDMSGDSDPVISQYPVVTRSNNGVDLSGLDIQLDDSFNDPDFEGNLEQSDDTDDYYDGNFFLFFFHRSLDWIFRIFSFYI